MKTSIKGYEGFYSVSQEGEIFSHRLNGFVRPLKLPTGYYQVGLSVKGIRRVFLVHRLVALAFIPNLENKPQVNHKNGVKNDNRVENLEWCSAKENTHHSILIGTNTEFGEGNGNSKLTLKQVQKIRSIPGTYTDIGKKFGISRVQVSNIVNHRQWKKV